MGGTDQRQCIIAEIFLTAFVDEDVDTWQISFLTVFLADSHSC